MHNTIGHGGVKSTHVLLNRACTTMNFAQDLTHPTCHANGQLLTIFNYIYIYIYLHILLFKGFLSLNLTLKKKKKKNPQILLSLSRNKIKK